MFCPTCWAGNINSLATSIFKDNRIVFRARSTRLYSPFVLRQENTETNNARTMQKGGHYEVSYEFQTMRNRMVFSHVGGWQP